MTISPLLLLLCAPAPSETNVSMIPAPDNGLQPRAAVDAAGVLHLVAFHGPRESGELLYRRSTDAGKTFGRPLAVTRAADLASATRASTCAQLAVGKSARAHVVWHRPASDARPAEVLYARLDDAQTAFEAPRAMSSARAGLEGGSAVAADDSGLVWIAWHAPSKPDASVKERALFVVESKDEGASFGPERMIVPTSVSACSSIQLLPHLGADVGVIYRSHVDGKFKETEFFNRDTCATFQGPDGSAAWQLDVWPSRECLATTYSNARSTRGWLVAFESQGGVCWGLVDPAVFEPLNYSPPTASRGRRHPAIAVGAKDQVLLAWIADGASAEVDALEFCLFSADGKPAAGTVKGNVSVAPQGVLSAVAFGDDRFGIVY